MNLNDFFPRKVCINLDKRSDRWERMCARFAEHGIEGVVRFPALDGRALAPPRDWAASRGAYGCLRSHLAVVEQARREDWPSVLIFEDDTVLDPEFRDKFPRFIEQLPADWDMLLFGGIHYLPLIRVAENVIKIDHSLSTYAYAMRKTVYEGFIELNRRARGALDENNRELQKRFNAYCFMPHLAWVEEDYSDVTDEQINLWWLRESLVLWGAEMDDVLKGTAAVIFHRNTGRHAARNLKFIADYFYQKLPTVALLVVEQGDSPSLAPGELPPHCRHLLLRDGGRGRAFRSGFEMFERDREYFVFLDSDVFLTREDVKANLLKCREYDFASGFREIWDLDEGDTRRILGDDLRWDYNGNYRPRPKAQACGSCCIFTKRGMLLIGGWDERDGAGRDRTSEKVAQRLRVYQSPNPVRRLSRG
ncbi:MAG TPA: glycosyltransferase family 25 protein [Pyrinomonadaceae bacterium]|nr:glycosyltransferase family 25 protein [Pyrinomonadaceae bacterium]